jgi:hypothetical protein
MPGSHAFNPEPLALFLTWTTYGSWLPGDARGWADKTGRVREPNTRLRTWAASRIVESMGTLNATQRATIASTIKVRCTVRGWPLLAVACRGQHVHVVVVASGQNPDDVSRQLKAWTTRALRQTLGAKRRIWTRGCSRRRLFDERGVAAAVTYVNECQDRPRER